MGGKTSQSSQTIQIPPEVLARYNAVNARAENAANRQFAKYSTDPNAFVAGLTDAQKAGIQQTMGASGQAQGAISDAYGITQGANRNVDPSQLGASEINQYMNPYMQNVMGSTAALLNQQNQQAMAGQTGNAIRSGAFGGDRAGIAAANLAQQQQMASGKILSDIASQGYNQALQTAQQQQGLRYQSDVANRQNQAAIAQQLANLGLSGQQAALQGAQAQLGAGQVQQQTEQAGKTALYNQFQQEQSFPFQVAQFLANIAEGTGALSGSTTTSNVPGGFFSDERLKEDIHVVGKTFDGQPIYKYRYKGDPKHQIGLLAQDVEKHHPHAVGLAAGYKTVDYDKATEAAEHKGHFASGGLAAESMGGHVAPEHMGEGYADGGSPALQGLSPADFAAILEAQSKMYAPFSEAGMNFSGSPVGGKGYVPEASLPVAGLVTPNMDVETPESGLEQAAAAADAIGTLGKAGMDIYGYGSKKYQEWKKNHPSSDVSEAPMGEENFASGGFAGYAIGGSPDDQNLFGSIQSGAKAPNEDDKSKLDIPTENNAPQQIQAPSSPQQGPSGLQQLGQIAQIAGTAAMMFSDKRLKQDVQPIGKTFDGQTVYKYRFKGDPKFQMGLLAQEVEKHHPHAVGLAGGYKTVNYDKATEAAEHRGHFGTGGIPYGGGLSIPTGDGQQRQLLTASASMPKQQSGLSQLADVASLAQTGMDIGKGLSSSGPKEVDVQKLSSTPSSGSSAANSKLNDILSGGITMANGGLAGRHGYATDGSVDDSTYFDMFGGVHDPKDFQRTVEPAIPQERKDYARSQAESMPLIGGLLRSIHEEDANRYAYNQDPANKNKMQVSPSYTPPASAPEKAVDEGMSDTEFQAMLNKLDEGNQSARSSSSGLAGGSENKVSAADEQALMDKLRFADAPSVSEGAPVAEALGDVSQMETTTPEGATGSGGLSPKDAPNVAPVAAAAAPAKTEAAPATGLAGATKPETKAETTGDGKPAHWYTDPKNIIPLLQGIAAMGVTPTRSWGVALSSGLGQGLKGYQQQRQFEIDKAAKQAETKLTQAATLQTNVEAAAAAARARRENSFDYYGEKWVIPEVGNPIKYIEWRKMANPPPLQFSSLVTGIETGTDMPLAKLPSSQATSTAAGTNVPAKTTVASGAFTPTPQVINELSSAAEKNMISGGEDITRNTVVARKELADKASNAYAQEPQLSAMATSVSKIPEDSVLTGNTLSEFIQGQLMNWNKFVSAIHHPELSLSKDELTEIGIRDKAKAAYQLGIGRESVEALETAAAAVPGNRMTRDASIAITANMLIDKQRAIDAANYENYIYNNVDNARYYDATQAITKFGEVSAGTYEEDKRKLISLLDARVPTAEHPEGESVVSLLMSGRTTPAAVDDFMETPGISRYFISGNR